MMAIQKAIDWTKPHLRIVYLVEAFFRDPTGGERVVRWCGPPDRTGSGFVAYPTLGPASAPPSRAKGALAPLVAWEARLSRCSFDSTIGSLKQHIQAISQVSLNVALGDDDNPTAYTSSKELRDMALEGRWMGHQARLILVDADELERFEVVADGTWDRDPTRLGPVSFKMTIDVGDIVPPTLDWPQLQVPDTVDNFETKTYATSAKYSPNGSASPAFRLNPEQSGKWLGETFGGATHQSIGGTPVWREVVPYGVTSTMDFACVSPRFDQFCYDLVVESSGGLVKISADASRLILVFNNNDPVRGPVGTCVTFSHVSGFDWYNENHRVWANVAGGRPILRPAGYSDISYSGNPELGDNSPGGGVAIPTNTTINPGAEGSATVTFGDIIQDPHFLDSPSMLHPDALSQLASVSSSFGLPYSFRNAAIPRDLTDDPISYREALESLMRSLPGDLVLRMDAADLRRKYFPQVRQQPGQEGVVRFVIGDLANADSPPDVIHMDNPDGYYSNETNLRTSDYYFAPVITANHEVINPKTHHDAQVVDILEQSSSRTGRVVVDDVVLKYWRFEDQDAFREWARVLEAEKSRPQKVLEAVHGFRSMRLELGTFVAYNIDGVLSWPGQIRGLRMDLDSQTVKVVTYHQPFELRVVDTSSTVNDKARIVAERKTPHIDRRGD